MVQAPNTAFLNAGFGDEITVVGGVFWSFPPLLRAETSGLSGSSGISVETPPEKNRQTSLFLWHIPIPENNLHSLIGSYAQHENTGEHKATRMRVANKKRDTVTTRQCKAHNSI